MRQIPVPQEIYRHCKGNLYQIITVAEHPETGEQHVVYQALYGDFRTYVYPLSMFMGKIDKQKYPEARQEYYFERLDREKMPKKPPEGKVDAEAGIGEKKENAQTEAAGKWETEAEAGAITEKPAKTGESGDMQNQDGEGAGNIDPMVIEFLDASSYEERLNILSGLHHRITNDMIDIMSAVLDIEVKPGDIEERYAEFRGCLALMGRFECNRLR